MALAQYSNSFHGGGGHGDVAGIDLSHYTPEAVAARQAPLSGPAPPLKYATVLGDVRGSLRDKKAHEHWKGDLMDGVAGGAVGAGCGVAYKMGRTIASTLWTNAVFASATIALAQYANVIHIDTSRARELVGGVAPAAATAFERYRPAPKVLWKDLEARARDLEARARRNEHRAAGVVAGFDEASGYAYYCHEASGATGWSVEEVLEAAKQLSPSKKEPAPLPWEVPVSPQPPTPAKGPPVVKDAPHLSLFGHYDGRGGFETHSREQSWLLEDAFARGVNSVRLACPSNPIGFREFEVRFGDNAVSERVPTPPSKHRSPDWTYSSQRESSKLSST